MKKEIFLALKIQPLCFNAPGDLLNGPFSSKVCRQAMASLHRKRRTFPGVSNCFHFVAYWFRVPFSSLPGTRGGDGKIPCTCADRLPFSIFLHIPNTDLVLGAVFQHMPTVPPYLPKEYQKTQTALKSYSYNILSLVCYGVDPECLQKTCTESVVLSPDAIEEHFRRSGLVGRS